MCTLPWVNPAEIRSAVKRWLHRSESEQSLACVAAAVSTGAHAGVLTPLAELYAVATSAERSPTTVFNPVAIRRLAKARERAGMVGNTGKTKKTTDSPGFPGPALYSEKCVLNKCMQDFF